MNGYGSHTYSLINEKDERIRVKFHLKTQQGIKNLTDQEAEAIIGKCRESHQRDLLERIDKRLLQGLLWWWCPGRRRAAET